MAGNRESAGRRIALDCAGLEGVRAFLMADYARAVPETASAAEGDPVEIRLLSRGIQPMEAGQREFTMQGGDLLVLPRGTACSTLHRLYYRATVYSLQLDARAIEDGAGLLGLEAGLARLCIREIERLEGACYEGGPELEAQLCGAFTDLASADEALRLWGRARLICFLCSLPTALRPRETRRYSPMVRRAVEYINDSITTCGDLEEIAAEAGASLSHFKTKFTREVGVTPLYYVNWRKIASAKRLLAQDYSITEVSMRLGFNSPAYFSTVFRAYTSRTPRQYKAMVDEELKKQRHITNS